LLTSDLTACAVDKQDTNQTKKHTMYNITITVPDANALLEVANLLNGRAAVNSGTVGQQALAPAQTNKDEAPAPTDKAPRGRPAKDKAPAPAEATKDDVKAAMRAAVEKHNKGEALEALLRKKYKVPEGEGIKSINPKDYDALVADIKAMCSTEEEMTAATSKDPWDD